ncbi:MAG: hypothetical protein K6E16_12495 [Lachnospiraceae bacterium]|nr:hypothetical protein [Lachnospiraceae bacterium]
MEMKYHKRAKIMTLIPLIVFIVSAAILIPITVSYFSTGSDPTAMLLIFVGSMILIHTAPPCLVLSILGTVAAAKAVRAGFTQTRKFFVLGIVELAIYSIGAIGSVIAVIMNVIAAG